jgi:hypothetical protein
MGAVGRQPAVLCRLSMRQQSIPAVQSLARRVAPVGASYPRSEGLSGHPSQHRVQLPILARRSTGLIEVSYEDCLVRADSCRCRCLAACVGRIAAESTRRSRKFIDYASSGRETPETVRGPSSFSISTSGMRPTPWPSITASPSSEAPVSLKSAGSPRKNAVPRRLQWRGHAGDAEAC